MSNSPCPGCGADEGFMHKKECQYFDIGIPPVEAFEQDTKEVPGALDAFETLRPGEKHFTLQGGDPLAPPTIFFWVLLARASSIGRPPIRDIQEVVEIALGKVKPPETEARVQELQLRATNAEQIAWDMQAYQRGESSHSDEALAYQQSLEAGGTTIQGGSRTALEKLLWHRKLNQALRMLGEAAYQANEAKTLLDELAPAGYFGDHLEAAVNLIKRASFQVTPRRAGALD